MRKLRAVLLSLMFMLAVGVPANAATYYFSQVFDEVGTITGSFSTSLTSDTIESFDGAPVAITNLTISFTPVAYSPLAAFTATKSTSTDGSNYLVFLLSTPSGSSTYVWSDGYADSAVYSGSYPETLIAAFDATDGTYIRYIAGNPDGVGGGNTGVLLVYYSSDPTKYYSTAALNASTEPPAAVPVPAALLLFAPGLFGLAAMRRKLF